MPSMLSVQDQRRSRSKSPGGRERERSRSNVRDDRDDDRRGERSRKSSRKYSESESEDSYEEDKRRSSSSKSSKKQYDSPSEDEKRRRRKSKYDEDDREDDRYKSSRSRKDEPRSKYRSPSVSEDDRRSSRKSVRKKAESESEDDRRGSKRKESKRSSKNDESSDNEDISIVIQRKSKSKKDDERTTTPRSSASHIGSGPAAAPMPPAAVPYPQPGAYGYPPQPAYVPAPPGAFPDATRHMSYTGHDPRYAPPPVSQYAVAAPLPPPPSSEPSHRPRAASNAVPQYADQRSFQYAQVDPRVKYKYEDRKAETAPEPKAKPQRKYDDDDDDVITPEQLNARIREKRNGTDKYKPKEVRSSRDDPYSRDPTYREKDDVKETARRVSRLSMSGGAALGAGLGATLGVTGHAPSMGGGKPPASPLLEAYRGTYQSISPMPSALVLANHKDDSDLSDFDLESDEEDESSGIDDKDPNADIKRKIWKLEKEKRQAEKTAERARNPQAGKRKEYERVRPLDNRYSADSDLSHMALSAPDIRSPRGSRKSVTFYDAEDDAREMAAALKGNKPPNVKPLIKILPSLSIDDLDALKAEYKKYAKIEGQGINLSKHIKARVPGYLGKAAYACSLGQWEGEGFWANCYYQVGASRRELLIESLMGRTNQQIREIKNFFKDKKYDDDLEKCMKTELKADKFRTAIMLALEERRMPETIPIDPRIVREDVRELHETLHGPGGESAMIQIIVLRSDAHLRHVLRAYEQTYGDNFARAMINKSKNLVGETLAHILNGALNRPMRDALLLHQAIAETAPGKERAELLISRLVRMHWEPRHLEKVKEQYANRYGRSVEAAIKKEIQANMKTEEGMNWTTFCINLLRSSDI